MLGGPPWQREQEKQEQDQKREQEKQNQPGSQPTRAEQPEGTVTNPFTLPWWPKGSDGKPLKTLYRSSTCHLEEFDLMELHPTCTPSAESSRTTTCGGQKQEQEKQ